MSGTLKSDDSHGRHQPWCANLQLCTLPLPLASSWQGDYEAAMLFAAIIEYGDDKGGLKATHPAHRAYLRTVLASGQLRAAGPFADEAGALWVLEAASAEAAEEIVTGGPLVGAGIITSWRIRPFAYWSAQDAKGAR